MPPSKVNVIDPATGKTFGVDEDEAARLEGEGWTREGAAQKVQRLTQERVQEDLGGTAGTVAATVAGGFRTISGGGSDAILSAAGIGDDLRQLRELHGTASLVGEIGGAFLPVGLPAMATRAGQAVGGVAEGASVLSRIGAAAKAGAVEGAIYGAGSGVSDVSLSSDPLSLERVVSTIGSHTLFGAATGGAAGGTLKAAGIGLRGVQSKLDDIAARGATAEVDDAARVALRDEVAAFRKEAKEAKAWLAAKDTGVEGLNSVGARTLRADKALDRLLDDPKALVDAPKQALRHLRVQESALQEVADKADEVRAALVKQGSANRLAALDRVTPTLEKNRALQAKITELTKPVEKAAGMPDFAKGMIGGQAFGLGASVVGAIPIVGPALAPLAGGFASKLVTGGAGKMIAPIAKRTSQAIEMVLSGASKFPPVAPVLASKALAAARYAPSEKREKRTPEKPVKKGSAAPRIAADYKRVTDEIKSQTMYDPAGRTVMRPEARMRLGATFDGLRPSDPILADKLETLAARRIEFLGEKIPRKPDAFALNVGPDAWQPSDMEMRAFARYVHAVEDPAGVFERVAGGTVTPEDAEAMKAVYPEMYRDFQEAVMLKLPTLRKQLPYQKRLALSVFSDVPVDPALHPRILGVLQRSFVDEPGTEGGMQAPQPQAQFGSVKNQEATASQERQGLT